MKYLDMKIINQKIFIKEIFHKEKRGRLFLARPLFRSLRRHAVSYIPTA